MKRQRQRQEIRERVAEVLSQAATTERLDNAELAERLGTDRSSVSRYRKKRRTPDREVLYRIAREFKVRIEWLLDGGGEMREETPAGVTTAPAITGNAEAAAYVGHIHPLDRWPGFLGKVPISELLHRELRVAGATEEIMVVRNFGDAMEPLIPANSLMLVDGGQNRIRSEGIYLLAIDGEFVTRRAQSLRDGTWRIVTDNTRYDSRTIGADEVAVIGRVLWAGRSL